MGMDVSNFYAINTVVDENGKKSHYFHEFKNNNGKAGELVTMGDGFGDAKEAAAQFIKDGFDPNKIKINGQLASDVFKKENDTQKTETEAPKENGIKNSLINIMKNFFAKKSFVNVPLAKNLIRQDNSLMIANQQNEIFNNIINHQNFMNQMHQDNMMHMQMSGMM